MAVDYVDRAALRTALFEANAITMRGIFMLNQFPAADVVEQKQGKWLDVTTLDNEFICWVCSECRHGADFVDEPYNFCPNCGADMRGDNDV